MVDPGADSNRSAVTIDGATTDYCYGPGDRLTWTSGATPVGAVAHDGHGNTTRPVEHQAGLRPTIEMGARPYDPQLGRFLTIDPVPGGSANNYDYTNQNPIGATDLGGTMTDYGNGYIAVNPSGYATQRRAAYTAIQPPRYTGSPGDTIAHMRTMTAHPMPANRYTHAFFPQVKEAGRSWWQRGLHTLGDVTNVLAGFASIPCADGVKQACVVSGVLGISSSALYIGSGSVGQGVCELAATAVGVTGLPGMRTEGGSALLGLGGSLSCAAAG
jgi:RHS repeat-associated protein